VGRQPLAALPGQRRRPAKHDATRPDPAAWRREHGHRLWLIDQFADQASLDRDPASTTVTVTISSPS
jgi:hypothetical protein